MKQVARLAASDGDVNDWFGVAVATSGGATLVGANQTDDQGLEKLGKVYVFEPATCSAGRFISVDADGAACEDCAAGRISTEEKADACDRCPINTYSGAGSTECSDCAEGYFAGFGSGSCSFCSQGQYQAVDGEEIVCLDCANGTTSSLGLFCSNCTAGYFADDDLVNCVPCAAGRFSNGVANSECQPCAAGRRSDAGASECEDCSRPASSPSTVADPAEETSPRSSSEL